MKIYFLIPLILFLVGVLPVSADPLLQPNDRLAFCGDGLTGGPYTEMIEKYLVACQSIPGLDMSNSDGAPKPRKPFSAGSTRILRPSNQPSSRCSIILATMANR